MSEVPNSASRGVPTRVKVMVGFHDQHGNGGYENRINQYLDPEGY